MFSCKKEKNKNNANNAATVEASINISGNDNKQVIQGFGCATVFAPPNTSALTSEEFDRLFGSANGQVGLNTLRIRIATDDAWRAIELNYAKMAIQRGAKVFASPWSPPANMKTNNSLIKGKLLPDSAAAYAKYLNDFAVYMANNGAPLYGVSVQNEPDWEPSYEGCVWTAIEMRDFLKNHGAAITATRLIAPELVNNNQTYVNTILSDDAAAANLDILGTHLYGGGIIENALATAKGKEVWMTEHLDTLTTYTANLNTAIEIHDCFTKANFNAYIWWYGKRFYGLIGQDGIVTKRGYIVSHFARFIKQGAIRLGTSANTRNDVLISAYRNGTKKVIVAINWGVYNVKQKINFQSAAVTSVIPYVTTSSKNVEQGAALTLENNVLEYTLPAGSIVTFVEQ
ncbi:glycoside hydrolase [Lacibacter sediminis]|uniref:Glucuronoxylanase XynC n=1 Tax=Lacibacter sediminis TaxID=2760713 RepID=A0A7G5XFF4_9BACT|nr:glucuronoxylanase XynC [Lacibacter sediminis]QNA44207.1 glucuronoxylanase XynC [Lacibacter sediminis]